MVGDEYQVGAFQEEEPVLFEAPGHCEGLPLHWYVAGLRTGEVPATA